MEQDAGNGQELPPFSFSKKPIRSHLQPSVIPSNLPCRQGLKDTTLAYQPSFNNINYDEQIRAPRMSSTAANYTYEPDRPRPFTGKSFTSPTSLATQEDSVSQDKQNSMDDSSKPESLKTSPSTPESTYHPATADINQSTRRYSGPVKPAWTHESNRILSPGLSQARKFSDPEEAGEIQTPESELQKENLLRAMANLNNNVTTIERSENSSQLLPNGLRSQTSDRNRKGEPAGRELLQQVYNMKKPMCLPAVLRPINDEAHLHEEDLRYDSSPELRLPNSKFEENPFELMVRPSNEECQKIRPTRDHWRPDSSTDHCINCFEQFATFFYPQRKRRHHCRFCGLLFCHNCLYKSQMASFDIASPTQDAKEKRWSRTNSGSSNGGSVKSTTVVVSSMTSDELESGIMLDAKARFVVPMFKNLVDQSISMGELQEKFHTCKICRSCGNNYQRLSYLFNQRNRNEGNIDAPYVFIENPYTRPEEQSSCSAESRPFVNREIEASTYDRQRRHSSLTSSVPSDWTWSSF